MSLANSNEIKIHYIIRRFISSACEPKLDIGCKNNTKNECTQICNENTSIETCQEYNTKAEKCNEGIIMKMNAEIESCFQAKIQIIPVFSYTEIPYHKENRRNYLKIFQGQQT